MFLEKCNMFEKKTSFFNTKSLVSKPHRLVRLCLAAGEDEEASLLNLHGLLYPLSEGN